MDTLPNLSVIKFKPNSLTFIREQINLTSKQELNDSIDLLHQWIEKQNHFEKKNFPREYLERSIVVSKGSVERAKRKMEKTCTYRTLIPDLLDFSNPRYMMKEYEGILFNFVVPQVTDNHERVYVLKVTGKQFSSFTNYYKFFLMICEYLLTNDYTNGLICVVDYRECVLFEVIKTINISELRQVLSIVTDAFSLRMKAIHFITSSKSIDMLVSITKQVVNEKIASRIHVHKDLNSFYDPIPMDLLPVEYGGKEKSLYELQDNLYEALESPEFTAHLQEMRSARTNESKRHSDSCQDVFDGMPGSFRLLKVD